MRAWILVLAACHPHAPVAPDTCGEEGYDIRWGGAPLHVEVHHGKRIASVYVVNKDRLFVLHASAQLGTAVYGQIPGSPTKWKLMHGFEFKCRWANVDTKNGPDCLDFIKWHDGWLANVSEPGDDRVFDISKRVAPVGARFAVVSYDPHSEADLPDIRACRGVTGDALLPTLQAGETPDIVEVDPREWPEVRD